MEKEKFLEIEKKVKDLRDSFYNTHSTYWENNENRIKEYIENEQFKMSIYSNGEDDMRKMTLTYFLHNYNFNENDRKTIKAAIINGSKKKTINGSTVRQFIDNKERNTSSKILNFLGVFCFQENWKNISYKDYEEFKKRNKNELDTNYTTKTSDDNSEKVIEQDKTSTQNQNKSQTSKKDYQKNDLNNRNNSSKYTKEKQEVSTSSESTPQNTFSIKRKHLYILLLVIIVFIIVLKPINILSDGSKVVNSFLNIGTINQNQTTIHKSDAPTDSTNTEKNKK